VLAWLITRILQKKQKSPSIFAALYLPELLKVYCWIAPETASLTAAMARLALHHVNVIVTDLPRSLAFYEKLFGLTIIERPPFKNAGAWLGCGALQVHLSVHPPGSFRTGNVDGADTHFAFRTDDFDSALATLTANGFREDGAEDDPMHVMVRRNGPAGFPQLFLLDPDRNIIGINGAP
jgi:catechol 2,3-dioxygenase-like lactoylglutathione lyase family enzyme